MDNNSIGIATSLPYSSANFMGTNGEGQWQINGNESTGEEAQQNGANNANGSNKKRRRKPDGQILGIGTFLG
jgi:hypothetical protein